MHSPCPSFSKPHQEEGRKRSFLVSPIPLAPGSSQISLLLSLSGFAAAGQTHPLSRNPHLIPPQHPIADGISMESASSEMQEEAFSGFLPHISPVEDADGWVLPALIGIWISVSCLAIGPVNAHPELLLCADMTPSGSPRPQPRWDHALRRSNGGENCWERWE